MATINGTLGNDLISGTPQADLIYSLAGNDTIFGLEGNDTLFGNQGNDTIFGNQGNDLIFGGKDNDFLYGGKDNDTLYGNQGNDTLFGNEGNDVLYGGKGNDVLYGGKGNDRLYGDLGNDTLYGDLGSDTMTGGEGRDLFVVGRRATGTTGSATLANADYVTDFTRGQDRIGIQGLTFNQLEITAGTGQFAGSAVIRDTGTGDYLAILQGVTATQLTATDFLELPGPTPTPTPPTPTPPTPTPPTPTPPTPTPPTPTPAQTVDLALEKSVQLTTDADGDNRYSVGDTITYTVNLLNNGPANATGVVVTDALPTNLQIVNNTPSVGDYNPATGIWTIGNLADNANATLRIQATINSGNAGDVITNTASITGVNQTDSDPTNNTDTVAIALEEPLADLRLTKTVSNTAPAQNSIVTYTLTLFNDGLNNATGVQVRELLPTGLTIQGTPNASVGTFNQATGIWTIGNLASRAPLATLTFQARVDQATGDIVNTATATATERDPNPSNNVGTVTLQVGAPGRLITGTAGNDNLVGGSGNDTLVGRAGDDTLSGAGGVNEFRFNQASDSSFLTGFGDTITDFNPLIDASGRPIGDVIRLSFKANDSNVEVAPISGGVTTLSINDASLFTVELRGLTTTDRDVIRNSIIYGPPPAPTP
uniref:M10 family metallopeptidase C-terminal domain-containing protein n=1 Tax=Desertifilum tharense IPPAS B-1220 TaxID=1781255 RepID=A0ACD5GWB0_9CYAN